MNEQQAVIAQGIDHTAFWRRKVESGDAVVADGQCYKIGADYPKMPSSCKGFGGYRWRIRFFDGRIVVTDNLWHNGTVPDAFRAQLPDNATLESADPPALLVSLLSDDLPF